MRFMEETEYGLESHEKRRNGGLSKRMGRVPKEGKRRENGETWRRTQMVMLKTRRIYFEPPVAQNTNGPEKQGRSSG